MFFLATISRSRFKGNRSSARVWLMNHLYLYSAAIFLSGLSLRVGNEGGIGVTRHKAWST
jgi:hypothetical protein